MKTKKYVYQLLAMSVVFCISSNASAANIIIRDSGTGSMLADCELVSLHASSTGMELSVVQDTAECFSGSVDPGDTTAPLLSSLSPTDNGLLTNAASNLAATDADRGPGDNPQRE